MVEDLLKGISYFLSPSLLKDPTYSPHRLSGHPFLGPFNSVRSVEGEA